MHHVARAAALTALPVLLSSGCAIELGEGDVAPIRFDRSYVLGDSPLSECPFGTRELPANEEALSARVTFVPVREGCLVDIRVDDGRLLDRDAIVSRAEKLEGRGDLDSILAVDLALTDMRLEDQDGVRLDLSLVRSLTIRLDDEVVVSEQDIQRYLDGDVVRVTLPEATVGRFIEALIERRDLHGRLRVTMVMTDPSRLIPAILSVRTSLQPIVLVDGIAAKL